MFPSELGTHERRARPRRMIRSEIGRRVGPSVGRPPLLLPQLVLALGMPRA